MLLIALWYYATPTGGYRLSDDALDMRRTPVNSEDINILHDSDSDSVSVHNKAEENFFNYVTRRNVVVRLNIVNS